MLFCGCSPGEDRFDPAGLRMECGAMVKSRSDLHPANGVASAKVAAYSPEEQRSLEGRIVRLALKGKLRSASHAARRRHRKLGIPVTHKQGTKILKVYPGGRVEVLAEVPAPKYTLPDGVIVVNES